MKMKVWLLAVSAKHGGYCVAGMDVTNKKFVRLVTDDGSGSGPLDRRYFKFHPLDIIEVNILSKAPSNGAQTENYFIADYDMVCIGKNNCLDDIMSCVSTNHITPFGTAAPSIHKDFYSTLSYSLCVLRVSNIILHNSMNEEGDVKTKIDFETIKYDGTKIEHHDYSVTDIHYYNMMKNTQQNVGLGDGFILVSIGPATSSYEFYSKFVSSIFLNDVFL